MKTMNKSTKSKTQARPAVRQSTITVRDLADMFGKVMLVASFTVDGPEAYLRYPEGYQRYQARVLYDLVNFAGKLPACELTNKHASAFLDYVNRIREERGGKALSRATVLKMAGTASAVFSYGIDSAFVETIRSAQ